MPEILAGILLGITMTGIIIGSALLVFLCAACFLFFIGVE